MTEKKPTLDAQRRFEALPGMTEATIRFPEASVHGDDTVSGTIVDISVGCMCLRVPMGQPRASIMRTVEDGDFVEVELSDIPQRRWTVLGHLAWVWAPPIEDHDVVGSLGVDIAGVIEDDQRWIGKMRRFLGRGREIDVDRSARPIDVPARRRGLGGSPSSDDADGDEAGSGADEEASGADEEASGAVEAGSGADEEVSGAK